MKMNISRFTFVIVFMVIAIYKMWEYMPSDLWYLSIGITVATYWIAITLLERRYRIVRNNQYYDGSRK